MQPEVDNSTAPHAPAEVSDAVIGPTLPRLEVQVVNVTTERNNLQRRLATIEAELNDPSISEQERAEALQDLEFTNGRLAELDTTLHQLTSEKDAATVTQMEGSLADAPATPNVDLLTADAIAIAERMNEDSSDSQPQA